MQPIDLSKLFAGQSSADKVTESSTKESPPLSSASIEKQRLAIGLLLKQTLQNLNDSGILSIDKQKAILSAKKILPSEFTQLYIQDRLEQAKLSAALASQSLKPEKLTLETIKQWFSGQLIQSIVYQGTKNGSASLLLDSKKLNAMTVNSNNPFNSSQTISNELIKNTQVVTIKTSLDLQVGQQLLLQVNKLGSNISFDLKHSPKESNLISQYLNQLRPKQQALPQLLASLEDIASHSKKLNSPFTEKFINQVSTLIEKFPALSQLSTGKEVKSSIQNSGLLLESKIKHAPVNTAVGSSDLKAMLSQLILLIKNNEAILGQKSHTLENNLLLNTSYASQSKIVEHKIIPFDLANNVRHAQVQKVNINNSLLALNTLFLIQSRVLDQLEGVLSRIIINQFQTRESSDQSLLNFEIPFRHNDRQEVLQLKMRESFKEQEAENNNKIWTVNLAFNLQSIGGIRIYITLDKKDLAFQFWTEEKKSQALFQQYFYLLSERLINAGYSISQLAAFHGMPEEAEKELKDTAFIIDERV